MRRIYGVWSNKASISHTPIYTIYYYIYRYYRIVDRYSTSVDLYRYLLVLVASLVLVMFLFAKRIRTKVPGEYLRNANIAYINLRILPCAILMRATTAVQLQLYMYSAVVPVLSAISVYSCRCRDQVSHRTHWNTSTELLRTHTMSP